MEVIKRFFSYDINIDLSIRVFTWQHLVFIILPFLTFIFTIKISNKIKNSTHEIRFRKTLFYLLILLESSYHIHNWINNNLSLPLHLCSFSTILSILLLKTNNSVFFEPLFLIGPLGGFLALLIPDMGGFTYYNFRYYHFIITHLLIILIPLYYYKAYKMRVSYNALKYTYISLISLVPIVYLINKTLNKNYMFINEKPTYGTITNFIPEWPYYFIIFTILVFVGIYIIYLLSNSKTTN